MSRNYYIAELGIGDSIIRKYTESKNILGSCINAIEIFETPFDAVRSLNKTVKLMPEHHVSIYCALINCDSVTFLYNPELRIFSTESFIDFERCNSMALGSLVYSL